MSRPRREPSRREHRAEIEVSATALVGTNSAVAIIVRLARAGLAVPGHTANLIGIAAGIGGTAAAVWVHRCGSAAFPAVCARPVAAAAQLRSTPVNVTVDPLGITHAIVRALKAVALAALWPATAKVRARTTRIAHLADATLEAFLASQRFAAAACPAPFIRRAGGRCAARATRC